MDCPLSETEAAAPALALREVIARFARHLRRDIWQLCARSRRYRDLLSAFPAAAVAVVCRPRGDPLRARALRAIDDGRPLADIAAILAVPLWFRKLPPEAFVSPPASLALASGDTTRLAARLVNLVPENVNVVAGWLHVVGRARLQGGDDFAIWIAGQRSIALRCDEHVPLLPLALYMWHSRASGLEAGERIGSRWRPQSGLVKAAGEARLWLIQVLQELCRCNLERSRPPVGTVRGLDFVPLETPAEIVEEAIAMNNCLVQYVGLVASGACRLYSVRSGETRVATLEVRAADTGSQPFLRQIKARGNVEVATDVLMAAQWWATANRPMLARELRLDFDRHSREAFERLVWAPFATADVAGRQLTMQPTIGMILRDLDALATWAKKP